MAAKVSLLNLGFSILNGMLSVKVTCFKNNLYDNNYEYNCSLVTECEITTTGVISLS